VGAGADEEEEEEEETAEPGAESNAAHIDASLGNICSFVGGGGGRYGQWCVESQYTDSWNWAMSVGDGVDDCWASRALVRRRRFWPPFHQFFTALSLRPGSFRAISAQRFPMS
jgi:hypothetical protein